MTTNEKECIEIYNNFKRDFYVGEVVFTTPNPPKDPSEIANYGLPKEERKFPHYDNSFRTKLFVSDVEKEPWYKGWHEEEIRRRYLGFWWYNGDNLEYATGKQYMFLQWWKITVSKATSSKKGKKRKTADVPNFMDAQRDFFYFWEYCDQDPYCFGAIVGTRRRLGKTAVSSCIGYLDTTENKDSIMAIQSKTDADGKRVFKKIVSSWKMLPPFLRPVSTGYSSVSKKLEFREPTRKNTKTQKVDYIEVLNSEIEVFPSSEEAIDGDYCSFIYSDEIGKTKSHICDIYERWAFQKETLTDGSDVIGKTLMTSTVEDLEKYGGENMKKIWDESSYQEILNGNRNTTSGVLRLFIPADYGFVGSEDSKDSEYGVSFVDEWGYSNREAARAFIQREADRKTGAANISYRRKYPLEESDMWLMEDEGCKFSVNKLYQQRKWNEENEVDTRIRIGNLYWRGGMRYNGVIFDDDPKGRFAISSMPPTEAQNRWTLIGDQRRPTCSYFRMGVDPTDHRAPTSGRGSNNAAYVVAMPSVLGFSRITPVCQYLYRHESPNDFYEDMLLMSAFYSCPILPESNKSGLINYFEDKGALYFIMNDPTEKDPVKRAKKFGMPSTGEDIRNTLLGRAQSYVVENVGYLIGEDTHGDFPFHELIDCMLDFAPTTNDSRWTKWDEVVAFMYALAACDADFNIIDEEQYSFNLNSVLSYYKRR